MEKLHTNQNVENLGGYNGLLVNFDALKNSQLFGTANQQTLDGMSGHHFERAENKM